MHQFLVALVSVVFVLGIMVLVHEFGHYAVAKLCGVRVEVFSIGFGKRLIGFRKGDTDYRISALPLGGYVKMSGENPMEAHTGSPDEFSSHPRWQRLLIAVAGPVMNIVLAIAILTGVYMRHFPHQVFLERAPVIGYVAKDTPADKAGIEVGDRITRIENYNTATWEDAQYQILLNAGQTVRMTVERNGGPVELKLPIPSGSDDEQRGFLGFSPDEPVVAARVEENMPAYRAGLRKGDQIVAIDDVHPRSIQAVLDYIQQAKDKPVELGVERDGKMLHFPVTPVLTQDGAKIYRIGFSSAPQIREEQLPFTKAFAVSVRDNKKMSMLIVEFLERMVERKVSIKQMSSVVSMAKASGEAASEPGWSPLLVLMASISVNLGIFNLLPIPILDGGVILLLLIEGALQRDINQQLKERIYQAAFVFLLLFAVLVIFNDIAKLTGFHA